MHPVNTPIVTARATYSSGGSFPAATAVNFTGTKIKVVSPAIADLPRLPVGAVREGQILYITLSVWNVGLGRTETHNINMGLLIGDGNADRVVNAADTQLVKNHAGELTACGNDMYDLNGDGIINSGDAAIVRTLSSVFLSD